MMDLMEYMVIIHQVSFAKFLSGPATYIPGETFIDNNGNGVYDEGIDTPLDTAFVHRGQILGVRRISWCKKSNYIFIRTLYKWGC